MFWSRYPQTKLRHVRLLGSFGSERGVSISPKPSSLPPPELVHRHSCIVPSPAAGKVMVIEWTDDVCHRHLADY
jgi:hypothetical protein